MQVYVADSERVRSISAEIEILVTGNIFSSGVPRALASKLIPNSFPSISNVRMTQCKRLCTNSEETRSNKRATTSPKTTMRQPLRSPFPNPNGWHWNGGAPDAMEREEHPELLLGSDSLAIQIARNTWEGVGALTLERFVHATTTPQLLEQFITIVIRVIRCPCEPQRRDYTGKPEIHLERGPFDTKGWSFVCKA